MDTNSYRDLTIPYIEQNPTHYNFAYPILSDILDSANFIPLTDGVYLKATYGHRYLSSTSNKTDNHGGFDYWSNHVYNGTIYSNSNKAPIICMCDGTISEVLDGLDAVLELTSKGRSVQVQCDSTSQAFGSYIKINYRHLSSLGNLAIIADTASGNIHINKGDTIGYMGDIGHTTSVHLHLSTETDHPINGNSFVNTARLFDPSLHPGILQPLKNVEIELLHDWQDSTLFRIRWPFNQTINRFEFSNQAFNIVFDKEEAYDTGSAIRDNHDCIPGINVYAYQFNGKRTAKYRYLNEMNNIPAFYPASPQRDTNISIYGYNHIPINYDEVAYVYDFVIKNLPSSHIKEDFIVKVSDIWGYTVEGTFNTSTNTKEQKLLLHSLFPNPTSDKIIINFSDTKSKTIKLFDVVGKLILSKESRQKEEFLSLKNFPSGIYYLTIKTQDDFKTSKIIKQ